MITTRAKGEILSEKEALAQVCFWGTGSKADCQEMHRGTRDEPESRQTDRASNPFFYYFRVILITKTYARASV
jgi:hypothetical protein